MISLLLEHCESYVDGISSLSPEKQPPVWLDQAAQILQAGKSGLQQVETAIQSFATCFVNHVW